MAIMVLTDAFVSIAGTDVSDHVKQVTINYNAELQDSTAMGDGTKKRLGGLKDWKVDIEFEQDYAASNIDSILFPLVGATAALIIRPVKSTVVGTGNPNYTGTGILEGYQPVQGAVGDLAKATASFLSAGTLSRATS